jgi:hypothetical protein
MSLSTIVTNRHWKMAEEAVARGEAHPLVCPLAQALRERWGYAWVENSAGVGSDPEHCTFYELTEEAMVFMEQFDALTDPSPSWPLPTRPKLPKRIPVASGPGWAPGEW